MTDRHATLRVPLWNVELSFDGRPVSTVVEASTDARARLFGEALWEADGMPYAKARRAVRLSDVEAGRWLGSVVDDETVPADLRRFADIVAQSDLAGPGDEWWPQQVTSGTAVGWSWQLAVWYLVRVMVLAAAPTVTVAVWLIGLLVGAPWWFWPLSTVAGAGLSLAGLFVSVRVPGPQ